MEGGLVIVFVLPVVVFLPVVFVVPFVVDLRETVLGFNYANFRLQLILHSSQLCCGCRVVNPH